MTLELSFVANNNSGDVLVISGTRDQWPNAVVAGSNKPYCPITLARLPDRLVLTTHQGSPNLNVYSQYSPQVDVWSGTALVPEDGTVATSLCSLDTEVLLAVKTNNAVKFYVSSDGITWAYRSEIGGLPLFVAHAKVARLGGRLCCVLGAYQTFVCSVSDDNGITWSNPLTIPDRWTNGAFGMAAFNGSLFLATWRITLATKS